MSDSLKSFILRYRLTIIMVPFIIGVHYGWHLMQNNRRLVAADEQIELPPITLARYVWKRAIGENTQGSVANAK